MEFTFPPTFLWGTATAAHQVEGSNVYNDTWVMEHIPGSPWFPYLVVQGVNWFGINLLG